MDQKIKCLILGSLDNVFAIYQHMFIVMLYDILFKVVRIVS